MERQVEDGKGTGMGRQKHRLHVDPQRFDLLADYIVERFGNSVRSIADVAGGQGMLARLLRKRGNYDCEVIDPRGWTVTGVRSRQEAFAPAMVPYYDLIVGLHPDEALQAVARAALVRPAVLIPCCDFWSEQRLGRDELLLGRVGRGLGHVAAPSGVLRSAVILPGAVSQGSSVGPVDVEQVIHAERQQDPQGIGLQVVQAGEVGAELHHEDVDDEADDGDCIEAQKAMEGRARVVEGPAVIEQVVANDGRLDGNDLRQPEGEEQPPVEEEEKPLIDTEADDADQPEAHQAQERDVPVPRQDTQHRAPGYGALAGPEHRV